MHFIKLSILIFIFFLFIFAPAAQGQFTLNPLASPSSTKSLLPPVNLSWWVVWENPSDFAGLIGQFHSLYPQANINVRKLRYEDYKDTLLQAWARDQGPDIFSIPNTWLKEYQEWIEAVPVKVVLKKEIESGPGCFRKKSVVQSEQVLMTPKDIKEKFVPQVEKDALLNGQIFALPLNLDTLVLYYNRELLDTAKIPLPPKTWEEFVDQVKKLTLVDKEGNIYQAGAALGASNNLERPSDILSSLMMQVGTSMAAVDGTTTFNQPFSRGESYFPAEEALRFYTDFQDKNKPIYTWNKDMPNAIDLFVRGKLAFFFGYAYHLPLIRAKNPNFYIGISPVPQPEGTTKEINFANYPLQVVSKKSQNKDWAWAFLNFASLNPQDYLSRAQRPTALRNLIGEQIKNQDLTVFVSQVLTSQSWYHGKNALVMEDAFKEMIDTVNDGSKTYLEAINFAVDKINKSIR